MYVIQSLFKNTLVEKIFQRQIMKQGLSGSVVDHDVNTKRHFTRDELKDIFSLNETTLSDTHDLIGCSCCSSSSSKNKVCEAKLQ